MADAVGQWWRPFVLVLAYCGLRPGEAIALRRRHFDDLGRLTIEGAGTEHRGDLEPAVESMNRNFTQDVRQMSSRRMAEVGPNLTVGAGSHLRETGSYLHLRGRAAGI
ncbi:MAG TPA: hypothetical protein VIH95_05720 [Acidimicrobiales bacterium]